MLMQLIRGLLRKSTIQYPSTEGSLMDVPEEPTALSKSPEFTMERYSYIDGDFVVNSYGRLGAKISVGSFCSIARGVTFFLAGNHPVNFVSSYPFGKTQSTRSWREGNFDDVFNCTKGNITIGNDVWIGANCTILSGVTIGHGAVIGANSVVTKNVAPYAIVCGNPGRVVRFRFTSEIIGGLLQLAWWEWDDDKIADAVEDIASPNVEDFLSKYMSS